MRRSSPVQQWLDSLPTDAETEVDKPKEHIENTEEKLDNKEDIKEKVTLPNDPEPFESAEQILHEEKKLDVPKAKEVLKRKSLESGVLSSTPRSGNEKKMLQRDYSVQSEGYTRFKNPLFRDQSLQSDASGSSGSSVLNVLGARKVDAESILIALGFGPSEKQQKLQRIPKRFLAPSKLRGISTEQFIKDEQHAMRMHDCGVFGYRGLTGNPHIPPSTIVAKIMECILQDDMYREEALMQIRNSIANIRNSTSSGIGSHPVPNHASSSCHK